MIVKQVDVRMIFHMIILKNKKTFLRIVVIFKKIEEKLSR